MPGAVCTAYTAKPCCALPVHNCEFAYACLTPTRPALPAGSVMGSTAQVRPHCTMASDACTRRCTRARLEINETRPPTLLLRHWILLTPECCRCLSAQST